MLQRKIFVFILSVVLSFASVCHAVPLSKTEDLTFQTKNDKEFVTDKEGKPFAGAVVLADENGRDITYFYKAGRKNGVAVADWLYRGRSRHAEYPAGTRQKKRRGSRFYFRR